MDKTLISYTTKIAAIKNVFACHYADHTDFSAITTNLKTCPYPLHLSRNLPEHLNVTTHLAGSIKESPVAGFLPRRSDLSQTQNFPKPLIKTSSPEARVRLMISITCSTT
jgi:hypothetical protein